MTEVMVSNEHLVQRKFGGNVLLIILWAIIGTLALSQGLIVLFLIRTRGNNLALAREVLRLQAVVTRVEGLESSLHVTRRRLMEVERGVRSLEEDTGSDSPCIVHLAAVGGRPR